VAPTPGSMAVSPSLRAYRKWKKDNCPTVQTDSVYMGPGAAPELTATYT